MDLRYLKWNGIYSLDGCCNAVHAPIDDTKQESADSRLRALGFPMGGDKPGDARKAAARLALAMLRTPANPHVKIRIRVTTSDCTLAVTMPLTDATKLKKTYGKGLDAHDEELDVCGIAGERWLVEVRELTATSFATIEVVGWGNEDWRTIAKLDTRTATAKTATATAKDFDPYSPGWQANKSDRVVFDPYPAGTLDKTALQSIAALDDASITQPASVPVPKVVTTIVASRSVASREGSGAVVQLPDISVKVRRAPKTLRPFVDLGFVQIKLTGADSIQSMMFRVYRSFEVATGIGASSADKLVYQEVLDRAQIDALVRTVPDTKTWIAPLGGMRGGILKRQIVERDGERYGRTSMCKAGGGARAFNGSHAPYKFKVWVSTDPHAFAGAVVKDLPPPSDARRTSIPPKVDEAPVDVPVVTPTPTDATVHDEAKAAESQGQSTSKQSDWPAITRGAKSVAFRKNKFWTSKPTLGKNLCGTRCTKHGPTFLADHAEPPDPFVAAFEKSAWTEYESVCKQRLPDNTTDAFEFAPFETPCDAILLHIDRIEQRVCCGIHSGIPADVKSAILAAAAERRRELTEVAGRRYPYAETFHCIERFVNFANGVVAATDARDEYLLYREAVNAADPTTKAAYSTDMGLLVNMRRNDVAGHRMLAGGVSVALDAGAFTAIASRPSVNNSQSTLPHAATKEHKSYGGKCACTGDLLLYPSYAPLSTRFFIAVRAAPLWVLALIDAPYVVADRNYMQPYSFFEHDMFHASDDSTRQQWITMYDARAEHMTRFGKTAKEVHEVWQENCGIILQEIDKAAAKPKEALELMFFYLLHEPVDNAEDIAKAPAVPERKSLLTRLAMKPRPGYAGHVKANFFLQELEHKLDIKFFGRLFAPIRASLPGAYATAVDICKKLTLTDRDT